MNQTIQPGQSATGGREFKRILREALGLAVVGLVFGFTANWISPRGLSLSRDYFPRPAPASAAALVIADTNAPPGVRETLGAKAEASVRLREKGLVPIDRTEAERLYRDPRYNQELIVFIDARNDERFQEGHVPGAYQFDRYYPERYLPAALPACLGAEIVVVYCGGGQCEDSEFAALALLEAGIPRERLRVFTGGMTEWTATRLPVELDGRRSGRLQEVKP